MKQFEALFKQWQIECYKCYVKSNKEAHKRARARLQDMKKMIIAMRLELHEHHKSIPKYEDMIHPSWLEDEDGEV